MLEFQPQSPFLSPDVERLRHTAKCLREDGFIRRDKKIDFNEFIQSTPESAISILVSRTENLVSGLGVLNVDGPCGLYNRHDWQHIGPCSDITSGLLDRYEQITGQELPKATRNVAMAIVYTHDLGNNLQRSGHSFLSAYLLDRIFKNFRDGDPEYQAVKLGVYLHDEPIGSQVGDLGDISKKFHPEAIWAAIAADKMDIGRHRLSQALLTKTRDEFLEILERVPHTRLQLYAKETSFGMDGSGHKAVFNISFSSNSWGEEDPDTLRKLGLFQWKQGDIFVPGEWHRLWKEANIPYAVSCMGLMEKLYCLRIAMMNSCLFALYPLLEEVRFQVEDTREKIGAQVEKVYKRQTWQEQLFVVWKNDPETEKNYKAGRLKTPAILWAGEQMYLKGKGSR